MTTRSPDQTLDHARTLLREVIAQRQPADGTTAAPTQLLNMLVHVANIQRLVTDPSADSTNAVKRLRDFANTIERLAAFPGEPAEAANTRQNLVLSFRQVADELSGPRAVAEWAAGDADHSTASA